VAQFLNDKDPNDPSTTSEAYDLMIGSWRRINTLLGGTGAMRAAGREYLPQHSEESDDNYDNRLGTNILFNAMEITLEHFVGRPFSDPVKLNNDVPPAIEPLTKNIDLQGNDITSFCRDWFKCGLAKGYCHVLIDMPQMNPEALPQTLQDERRAGRRPFWMRIDPENMIFAEGNVTTDPVSGELREMFTHVRISEVVTQRVGFAEVKRERIRVLEPGMFQVWEKVKTKKRKDEWMIVEQGLTGIDFIPIVTYYANRQDFMLAKPPLEDLAYLNVRHWQSMSDQISVLTVARFAMLASAGAVDTTGSTQRIGPRQLLMTKDANGRFYYVEHSGKAIGAGWDELEKLEESMEAYGATFLKRTPGVQTATARALDSAESVTPLQDMVMRFIDSVGNALDVTAMWLGLSEGGSVTILHDFGPEDADKEGIKLLIELRSSKDISRKAMVKEAQRLGALRPEYDVDEDFEQLKLEDKELKPLQPQVPGTFDPTNPDNSGKSSPNATSEDKSRTPKSDDDTAAKES
jgi:hypothetical protein